jgi:uncharacterized membrane protein
MQFEQQTPKLGYRGSVGSRARDFLVRAFAIMLGAALLVGAFVISVVFLAAALTVVLVFVGYFWWRTRHLRKQMRQQRSGERDIIEGTVLKSE